MYTTVSTLNHPTQKTTFLDLYKTLHWPVTPNNEEYLKVISAWKATNFQTIT